MKIEKLLDPLGLFQEDAPKTAAAPQQDNTAQVVQALCSMFQQVMQTMGQMAMSRDLAEMFRGNNGIPPISCWGASGGQIQGMLNDPCFNGFRAGGQAAFTECYAFMAMRSGR
jgi:hypothetical protein